MGALRCVAPQCDACPVFPPSQGFGMHTARGFLPCTVRSDRHPLPPPSSRREICGLFLISIFFSSVRWTRRSQSAPALLGSTIGYTPPGPHGRRMHPSHWLSGPGAWFVGNGGVGACRCAPSGCLEMEVSQRSRCPSERLRLARRSAVGWSDMLHVFVCTPFCQGSGSRHAAGIAPSLVVEPLPVEQDLTATRAPPGRAERGGRAARTRAGKHAMVRCNAIDRCRLVSATHLSSKEPSQLVPSAALVSGANAGRLGALSQPPVGSRDILRVP